MQGNRSGFWSDRTLTQRCPVLIREFREGRIKHCAYELGVGSEAYVTSNKGKKSKVDKDNPVVIPPGQFGLLLTAETVQVPNDAMAFISIRAGKKFRGLVNVSGFHVDPGYNDRLLFAVYNAGSQDIVLDYDQPTFMIWYADLDAEVMKPYPQREGDPRSITDEDIMKIQGEVASPGELKNLFDDLRNEVDKKFHEMDLKTQFNKWMLGVVATLAVGLLSWVVLRPALLNATHDSSASDSRPPLPSTDSPKADGNDAKSVQPQPKPMSK